MNAKSSGSALWSRPPRLKWRDWLDAVDERVQREPRFGGCGVLDLQPTIRIPNFSIPDKARENASRVIPSCAAISFLSIGNLTGLARFSRSKCASR